MNIGETLEESFGRSSEAANAMRTDMAAAVKGMLEDGLTLD
jgi:hypothetical protein